MNHIAKSLATNGYAVFNINYRLSPKFQHPAAIEDLHEAVEYMKRHAKKYQLNKNKIALWGYSSGGHTVSYYALKNKKQVNLVVSGGAPYDLSVYPSSGYVKGYLGGFRDQMIDRYKEASPINHVTKDAPAFFLYHAKSDNLVEYEQMINFEKMLKKSSVKHETHSVAFWGHAMTFIISSESIKKGILFLDKNL